LLGLELLETARALPFLRPGAVVIANTECVTPVPVITGQSKMPSDLAGTIRKATGRLVLVPAGEIAARLGSSRVANVVCLGALAACSGIDPALWEQVVATAVPPKTVTLNLKAFAEGMALAKS
jgi:indolepyruvate ferredoxin oxidoreductase beta subunit